MIIKNLKMITVSLITASLLVGCGGANDNGEDLQKTSSGIDNKLDTGSEQELDSQTKTSTSAHIIATSVEKGDGNFILQATYTTPEDVGISSIDANSFYESSLKIFSSLKPNVQTKSVTEGYQTALKCEYKLLTVSSSDYYKLKCYDLNGDATSASDRTLKADELLVARWTGGEDPENVAFGSVSEFVSKTAVPEDSTGSTDSASSTDSTDTTDITEVSNEVPIANVGSSKTLSAKVLYSLYLDGSSSSDADGDTLTYKWNITSKPSTSNASLSSSTAVKPKFKADVEGKYVISLIVNDGTDDSIEDTITITASESISASTAKYNAAYAHIKKVFPNITKNTSIEIVGNYIYLLVGGKYDEKYLKIMNISNPEEPKIVSEIKISGTHLAVIKNYIYVSSGPELKIVDISNPATPFVINTYNSGHTGNAVIKDILVYGDYIYLSSGGYYGDVQILDISNPTAPAKIGKFPGITTAWEIQISGNYAYIAAQGSGLMIYDISNPKAPTYITKVAGSNAQHVAVSGDYAYILDTTHIRIINISDPTSPFSVKDVETAYHTDIEISGNYAYTTTNMSDRMEIIDISNPPSASVVGEVGGRFSDVAILDQYAFATTYTGLTLIDISKKTTPLTIGKIDTTDAQDVEIVNNYAYLADGYTGLKIVDISNPSSPSLTGELKTTNAKNVVVSGNYAYVADDKESIKVIDISNPATPFIAGGYAFASVKDMKISGNYLYVADYGNPDSGYGLKIINTSTGVTVGTYDAYVNQISISGKYAYLSSWNYNELTILDISNPNEPVMLSEFSAGSLRTTELSGNYIYIGFGTIDVSDPTAPSLLNRDTSIGGSTDFKIFENFAFNVSSSKFQIIDITNPEAFVNLGGIHIKSGQDIEVSGNYAYVADSSEGLKIIDISKLMN